MSCASIRSYSSRYAFWGKVTPAVHCSELLYSAFEWIPPAPDVCGAPVRPIKFLIVGEAT